MRAQYNKRNLRFDLLNLPKRLAIETELKRVLGSRMAGQFGIKDLVAPRT